MQNIDPKDYAGDITVSYAVVWVSKEDRNREVQILQILKNPITDSIMAIKYLTYSDLGDPRIKTVSAPYFINNFEPKFPE